MLNRKPRKPRIPSPPPIEYEDCHICKGTGKTPDGQKTWMTIIYGGTMGICPNCKGERRFALPPKIEEIIEELVPIFKEMPLEQRILVEKIVLRLIAKYSGVINVKKIKSKSKSKWFFTKTLKMDFLCIEKLVNSIKEEFNIDIFENEVKKINTVEKAVKLVINKLSVTFEKRRLH